MTSAPILNVANSNLSGKSSKSTLFFGKADTSKFSKVMEETSSKTSYGTTSKTTQDISANVPQTNLQETANDTSTVISQNAKESQSNTEAITDDQIAANDQQVNTNFGEGLPEETVSTIMDSIKKTLLKNLNITEEDLEQSMEAMGITYMDLLNKNVLINFVSQNYQISDSLEMVTNQDAYDSLKNIMAAMKEIIAGNIGDIELTDLTDVTPLVENNNPSGQLDTAENVQTDVGKLQVFDSSKKITDIEQPSIQNNTVSAKGDTDVKVIQGSDSKDGMSFQNPETDTTENAVEPQNQLNTENQTEEFSNELSQSKENVIPKKSDSDLQARNSTVDLQVVQNNTQQQNVSGSSNGENVTTNQSEMDSIIKQLVEKMKVSVTPDVKQLEMQLQPENLGKINLHLTAKEGIITAHIITQSEIVKEAVESQIGQLKDQFTQQGIQVKAIDVSVSSQSFDENLWQGGQQGQAEQGNQNNGNARYKRNLQMNLLDSNQTDLNEGELLEAEIMKQNGTNVSYLA